MPQLQSRCCLSYPTVNPVPRTTHSGVPGGRGFAMPQLLPLPRHTHKSSGAKMRKIPAKSFAHLEPRHDRSNRAGVPGAEALRCPSSCPVICLPYRTLNPDP